MEDHICSPEKYSMKNSYDKIYILLGWKNIYDKDVFDWIQIYFHWIKKIYFDIMKQNV